MAGEIGNGTSRRFGADAESPQSPTLKPMALRVAHDPKAGLRLKATSENRSKKRTSVSSDLPCDTLPGRTQDLCLLAHAAGLPERVKPVARCCIQFRCRPLRFRRLRRGIPRRKQPFSTVLRSAGHACLAGFLTIGRSRIPAPRQCVGVRPGCFAPRGDGPVRCLAALNRHAGICFEHAMQVGFEFLRGAGGPCTGQLA